MTVTTGAVFLPDVWSAELQLAREKNLVMAKLVKRRDIDIAEYGTTLELPFISNLAANVKSANTEVTFQSPTETKVQVSINQHYESSFLVEDRLSAQSRYDIAMQYREKAGYALALQVDTGLTSQYSSLTNTVGTGTTTITEANIVRAIQYLDDALVPQEDRYFVIAPSTMNQVRQISRFTEYLQTGGPTQEVAPMIGGQNGFVRNVYGVPVYMSANIQNVAGTPGIVHNLMFHRDAFVLAVQKEISVEVERKATWIGTAYMASTLWGYTVLRNDHAVDVRSTLNS